MQTEVKKDLMENTQVAAEELTREEKKELLQRLLDQVFNGDEEKLSIALGRPVTEINAWLEGDSQIDEDAMLKAHGLLQERAFNQQ